MKNCAKIRFGIRGTIMIFALLVVMVSTLVLAAWAQMMATATLYPDTTAVQVQDRIAMENARAMARQYLLSSLPSGATLYWEVSISNGAWGGCRVSSSLNSFWADMNFITAGNPFSPFGNRAFVVTKDTTLSNSFHSITSRFLIKSRSPLLAGYPLVVHTNSSTNLTATWVPTNKIYYTNMIGFPCFPQVPFTSGTNPSGPNGDLGYFGYFAAPIPSYTNNFNTNFTYTNLTYQTNEELIYTNATGGTATTNTFTKDGNVYTNYTGGNLTALLNPTDVESDIVRYEVPGTDVYLDTNTYRKYTNASITNLYIIGSTNQTNHPMHVVVPKNASNLSTITLTNTNNTRKIYLNKQNSGNMTIKTATTGETYNWWFAATVLPTNTTLTIAAPTTSGRYLNITGGFRIAQAMTNTGNLKINQTPMATGTNIDAVEFISDRVLWIEDGRKP